MRRLFCSGLLLLAAFLSSPMAVAAGGPLGIDHRLAYDNSGIWQRNYQRDLFYLAMATDAGIGLWEGGNNRLGKTAWQSADATAMAGATALALKFALTRERPSSTSSPNQWGQGFGNYSFPSGEVTVLSSIVTPYVLEYRHDNPWVYGLELLPAYDAVARMKVQGHWQTDVLGGFLLGTAFGYVAHNFKEPVTLQVLPGGFSVGLKTRF